MRCQPYSTWKIKFPLEAQYYWSAHSACYTCLWSKNAGNGCFGRSRFQNFLVEHAPGLPKGLVPVVARPLFTNFLDLPLPYPAAHPCIANIGSTPSNPPGIGVPWSGAKPGEVLHWKQLPWLHLNFPNSLYFDNHCVIFAGTAMSSELVDGIKNLVSSISILVSYWNCLQEYQYTRINGTLSIINHPF